MKKNLIAVAVLATSVFGVASSMAADGQVNFVGKITDQACEVVNNVANPLLVTLGTVSKSAFNDSTGAPAAGQTAAATGFTLQLKNCPDAVTANGATIKFDGTAAAGDNSVLALTQESGVATGVGIQLTDKSQAVLPLHTASTTYPLQAAPVVNNLDFVARYYSTSATITTGPANSVASFTVVYN
ncbi:fimbrial protein [Serratia fonticola]|uniref:fimbrial protein n=1 Tax=Serratia fonticola TaxID=47917 RepID=UPI003AB0B02D